MEIFVHLAASYPTWSSPYLISPDPWRSAQRTDEGRQSQGPGEIRVNHLPLCRQHALTVPPGYGGGYSEELEVN